MVVRSEQSNAMALGHKMVALQKAADEETALVAKLAEVRKHKQELLAAVRPFMTSIGQLLNGTREVAAPTAPRQAKRGRTEVVAVRGSGLRKAHHKVPRVFWEQGVYDFIKAVGRPISSGDYAKFVKIAPDVSSQRLHTLVQEKKLISKRDPERPHRLLYSLA